MLLKVFEYAFYSFWGGNNSFRAGVEKFPPPPPPLKEKKFGGERISKFPWEYILFPLKFSRLNLVV